MRHTIYDATGIVLALVAILGLYAAIEFFALKDYFSATGLLVASISFVRTSVEFGKLAHATRVDKRDLDP